MKVKRLSNIATLVFVGLVVAFLAVNVSANPRERIVRFTLHERLEVPGLILQPGDYVIALRPFLDSATVQIFNSSQSELYATLLTRPHYETDIQTQTGFTLYEAQYGVPPALKTWILPGQEMSRDFIYPEKQSEKFAKADVILVPSLSGLTAENY